MIWISGLRGAVAYALALKCYYDMREGNGDIILILSLIIAQTTIIVVSTMLYPIINYLNLKDPDIKELPASPVNEVKENVNIGPFGNIKMKIQYLHESRLKPLFANVNDSKFFAI